MPRVTSKLQVTVPKRIADRYGIAPGQELEWLEAGDAIRVVPERSADLAKGDASERLELFDRATERQRVRDAERPPLPAGAARGWLRDDLYARGDAD